MYDRIVVPVDIEREPRVVVEHALALADLTGGTLHLLAILDTSGVPEVARETAAYDHVEADAVAHAEQTLDGLRKRVEADGVACSTTVRRGEALRTLRQFIDEVDGDLCIVQREGRRPKLFGFLGRSLTERFARVSTVPLLSIPAELDGHSPPYRRILIATDGQRNSDRAERHVIPLAEASNAALLAVYVVNARFLNSPLAEILSTTGTDVMRTLEIQAAKYGIELDTELREGNPAAEILGAARERDSELIVVGTSGKQGLDRVVLGSVAGTVLRNAVVPVLVVPDTDDSERRSEPSA